MSKKDKPAKPAKEKKPRKIRAKMRSRKVSVAGHFADRLAANEKQRQDIYKAINSFPGVDPTVQTVETVHATLTRLAADGFVPTRKKGGRKGAQFTQGQEVHLSPEAVALLVTQCPKVATVKTFVGAGYDGSNVVPIRGNGFSLDDLWIGFVSKKWVNAVTVVA